jgi:hypothetical protein
MTVNLKYDTDPEALAWARENVQHLVDKLRRFEQQSTDEGLLQRASQWRVMANTIESELIGGTGCVIAAFDDRMPTFAPFFAAALTPDMEAKQEASRARIRERNARLQAEQGREQ